MMRWINNAKCIAAKCCKILADKLLDVAIFHANLLRSISECSFRFQCRRRHDVHSNENTEVKWKHALNLDRCKSQSLRNNLVLIKLHVSKFKWGQFGKAKSSNKTSMPSRLCWVTLVWPWALSNCKNRLSRCWDNWSIQVKWCWPHSFTWNGCSWRLSCLLTAFSKSHFNTCRCNDFWFSPHLKFQISPFYFGRI